MAAILVYISVVILTEIQNILVLDIKTKVHIFFAVPLM